MVTTVADHRTWQAYGAQAVVVSIDPRRVYVKDPADTQRPCVRTSLLGPEGQEYCWWQCTVKVGSLPVLMCTWLPGQFVSAPGLPVLVLMVAGGGPGEGATRQVPSVGSLCIA